jgi:hypothetical protein
MAGRAVMMELVEGPDDQLRALIMTQRMYTYRSYVK